MRASALDVLKAERHDAMEVGELDREMGSIEVQIGE